MTDIDFDELDRAVSSLMDKQREKEAPVVANENNSEVSAPAPVEENLCRRALLVLVLHLQ